MTTYCFKTTVLKLLQALVNAGEERSEDNYNIFKSAYGLMMFGVPNLGLRNDQLRTLVNDQPNQYLIQDLVVADDSEPSPLLNILHQRFTVVFKNRDLKVMSYYETEYSPTIEVSAFYSVHKIRYR